MTDREQDLPRLQHKVTIPDSEQEYNDLLAILERFACFYYTQGALTDTYLQLEARIVDDLFRVLGAERMTEIQSGCSVSGVGTCESEER